MLRKISILIFILVIIVSFHVPTIAGGISADAGLTPAKDKWIFRTQARLMQRSDDLNPSQREMKAYMFPMVVAYGLRSDITIMIRQIYSKMYMTMGSMTNGRTGLTDLFIMTKYRAYRYNSRNYTLGMAPFLGFEFPTGEESFSSNGTDLEAGIFISGRKAPSAIDINLSHKWNGLIGGGDDLVKNREIEFISAFAYQIDLGFNARAALAPVIEFSYNYNSPDKISKVTQLNSGESNIFFSPGLKFTYSSLIFESLIKFPVWQNQKGVQLKSRIGAILGIRIFL